MKKKSLHNLVKNLGENNFYHLSHEFNADVLDKLKKEFFPITAGTAWKNSKKACLAKVTFIIHCVIKKVQLLIKIVNIFLKVNVLLLVFVFAIYCICHILRHSMMQLLPSEILDWVV